MNDTQMVYSYNSDLNILTVDLDGFEVDLNELTKTNLMIKVNTQNVFK